MVVQEEISIWFPRVGNKFNLEENSFTINQIKSRVPSVVYFKLHCWNIDGVEVNSNNEPVIDEVYYNSKRWLIDKTYSSYTDTFDFPENVLSTLKEVQIELRIIGVDDDNPLYFTECMLMNKAFDGTRFYETDEKNIETKLNFNQTRHCELYSSNETDYLQIIRPYGEGFTTQKLTKSKCTVLAPHLDGETTYDKPKNIYLEFVNQTEQTTNIKTV